MITLQQIDNESGFVSILFEPKGEFDCHALVMAAFRLSGILWQPYIAERRNRYGTPGALHHPGIVLAGTDALSGKGRNSGL